MELMMNKRIIIIILILAGMKISPMPLQADKDPKNKVQVVVLDAGHGGKDSGALGIKSREKDIVLSITLKVGKYIKENFDDVKVIYTRNKDVFIPLHERANVANKNKADLFISIHANWTKNSRIYGTETFAMGEHRSTQNLEVAMKENSVITMEEDYTIHYEGFDTTSAESYIIFSLMQNIYLEQSITFASFVQEQFRERAKRADRGVKQDIFLVLWKTTMPSVLIETGFISNPAEENYLVSEQGQIYLASAIFRAFREYKTYIESKSVFTTNPPDPQISKEVNEFQAGQPHNDVIFMVQIASSTKPLEKNNPVFNDYDNIKILVKENSYKYAVGNYSNYHEAYEYSREISKKYQGAFVIAVENDEIIPLQEALDR